MAWIIETEPDQHGIVRSVKVKVSRSKSIDEKNDIKIGSLGQQW